MTYSEKLLDPRWQKRKTQIQMRDRFECKVCHNGTRTLAVHHKYYIPNTDPWDYCDQALILLCSWCHAEEEAQKARYVASMRDVLENGCDYKALNILVRGLLDSGHNYNHDFEQKAIAANYIAQNDHLVEKYLESAEKMPKSIKNY